MGFRVSGLGFRVSDLGFRAKDRIRGSIPTEAPFPSTRGWKGTSVLIVTCLPADPSGIQRRRHSAGTPERSKIVWHKLLSGLGFRFFFKV